MVVRGELPGSARQALPDGVTFLDAKPAVFEAMLDGWAMQQRARFLKAKTIDVRLGLIRRFAIFSNDYPWSWTCADVEAFISDRRQAEHPIAMSTARMYEITIRMFLTYITDPRYGWASTCQQLFDAVPQQILHEWNTIVHTTDYEGAPGRRPLTYDEVQALFDAADGRAEAIPGTGRKGALTAQRDAALLKTIYAFGLRRQEAWGLDITDLRYNPTTPSYRNCGALFVRFGKASRGGAAKRRTVLTIPEMDWIVPVLEHWRNEIRPLLGCRAHPALWVTERSDCISMRRINDAFTTARDAAGLDPVLDLHCLRHSYVTHLVEFDYPERFVSTQVGHSYAATTAIYTGVSDEYRNRLLRRSLSRHPDLWESP